jgi:hypothetical protein
VDVDWIQLAQDMAPCWDPMGMILNLPVPYKTENFFARIRVRVTLRLAVYGQSVRLGDNPLRLTTSNFIFQLNTCGHSPYVTSSLTRGRVCHLQLLLVLASAVILRSESLGTQDHILLPKIRDSPNLEGRIPVFIPPGTGFPFRLLLRLAGLRWRYSNPPPHGESLGSEVLTPVVMKSSSSGI